MHTHIYTHTYTNTKRTRDWPPPPQSDYASVFK